MGTILRSPRARRLRVTVLLFAAAAGAGLCLPAPWQSTARTPDPVTVLDGDTVRLNGTTYRLVGFDTPETGANARCESEKFLADRATGRLREIVAGGGIELRRVPCACAPGTEGSRQCNHGRLCATLTAHGRDVGDILVAEGLARRYLCGERRCPRRSGWCT
jgi:endonuclease YncB( thermonuclease family)